MTSQGHWKWEVVHTSPCAWRLWRFGCCCCCVLVSCNSCRAPVARHWPNATSTWRWLTECDLSIKASRLMMLSMSRKTKPRLPEWVRFGFPLTSQSRFLKPQCLSKVFDPGVCIDWGMWTRLLCQVTCHCSLFSPSYTACIRTSHDHWLNQISQGICSPSLHLQQAHHDQFDITILTFFQMNFGERHQQTSFIERYPQECFKCKFRRCGTIYGQMLSWLWLGFILTVFVARLAGLAWYMQEALPDRYCVWTTVSEISNGCRHPQTRQSDALLSFLGPRPASIPCPRHWFFAIAVLLLSLFTVVECAPQWVWYS